MRPHIQLSLLVLLVACKKETNSSTSSLHYPASGPRVNKTREVFYQNNQVKNIYTQHYHYQEEGELDLIERIDSTFSGGIWLVQTYSITYTYNSSKRLKNIFYSEGFGLNLQYNYVYDQKGKLLYSIMQQYPHYPDTTFYYHVNAIHSYSKSKGSLSTSYYSRNLDSVVNTDFEGGSTRLRIIYKRNHKTDGLYQYTNAYEPIISEKNERVSLEMIDYYIIPSNYIYTYERVYNENGYPVVLITYLDGKKRSEQFINYEKAAQAFHNTYLKKYFRKLKPA